MGLGMILPNVSVCVRAISLLMSAVGYIVTLSGCCSCLFDVVAMLLFALMLLDNVSQCSGLAICRFLMQCGYSRMQLDAR